MIATEYKTYNGYLEKFKGQPTHEQRFAKLEEELNESRSQIVSGFYEGAIPFYTQGAPVHELQSPITAEEANGLVDTIAMNVVNLGEQSFIMKNPKAISILIDYHDVCETEALSIDHEFDVTYHTKRRQYLLELGRKIIAEDPEIWDESVHDDFKLRYTEKE